jgi:hypothetical protein
MIAAVIRCPYGVLRKGVGEESDYTCREVRVELFLQSLSLRVQAATVRHDTRTVKHERAVVAGGWVLLLC